jgi:polysaccharide export outer membrane protein
VYVLGQVKKPGPVEIPYGSSLTLLTAIAKAGGIGQNGKKTGIQIRHKDDSGKITIVKVNLKDILNGKKPDVDLKAGDVIEVPESFF